ncbi:MAG: ATP-dependent DNA helicase [Candidatus Saccharimonadales bacterium]
MSKEFERSFKLLNAEQRQAVEQIDGPVLVIAGPGTGKTQLLSTRVAHILNTTDTPPSNILCLAFTNKAAVNMKERIILLAGQAGSRVNASTFHSFAADVMNIYPDYFWNAAKLSVATESTQMDIIESIVSELPLNNPLALKFAGQYTLLNDIQRSIQLSKEAGLTADKLRALIEVNMAYIDEIESPLVEILSQKLSPKNLDSLLRKIEALPRQDIDQYVYPLTSLSTVINESLINAINDDSASNRTTNTSRWKSRWVQTIDGRKGMFAERNKNTWWLNLADVYEQYRERLHQRGYYDYADMLVEVLAQLEQNSEILADVQERFNYVMIDEFQDTNPAQMRLAHLVADHYSAEGNPNLMAVGDDDQSIFKFNGAEMNNMLGFRRAYPKAKIILLTKNYRSSQAILDTAQKIIEQAETRLVNRDKTLTKRLLAAAPPEDKGEILATVYSSRELQLSEIAQSIKRNHRPDKSIAILARGHESLIKMAGLLQQLKVPVRYEQQANILDHEIVNQVYLIAKLLLAIQAGERDVTNSIIHQIIRWQAWGIDPKELWKLAAGNYPNKDWLDSLISSHSKGLKAIGDWFIWLARQTDNQPLAVTIEQIIGLRTSNQYTSPIREYFMNDAADNTNVYFHGLSAIQLLRALTHEFSTANEPSLKELVRFIEINKDNSRIVPDESPFITGPHAVQLLTVHKAKGLEFDHVYIIDATEDNWQPRKDRRRPPANLPLQPVGDDFDDYIRLMYVATTRARSSLTLTAYSQDHSGKDIATSSIILNALPVKKIKETNRQELVTILEENLRWPQLRGGQEKAMLKARLETYNLNVTHLLNFMDLTKGGPQYFKERNLLNLPEIKSASLSYGTAIHAAMDGAQKLANRQNFSFKQIVDIFKTTLLTEQLPNVQYQRYLTQGQRTLSRLFKDFKYRLPKGSYSEQKFKDIIVGRARISGKLDRVDSLDGKTRIIDYKTGRPLVSFDTRDRSRALKAYKHKLQLIFYALLLGGKSDAVEGQMVYVEAENEKNLIRSYIPTNEDMKRLRLLIEAVWPMIINLELPDVSAYTQDIAGIKAFEQDLLK